MPQVAVLLPNLAEAMGHRKSCINLCLLLGATAETCQNCSAVLNFCLIQHGHLDTFTAQVNVLPF